MRYLVVALLAILLITFIRAFIGLIGKAVGDLFQPSSPGKAKSGGGASSPGGELKPCATCGIYTSAATAVKKSVGGSEHVFCSADCRDKFKG